MSHRSQKIKIKKSSQILNLYCPNCGYRCNPDEKTLELIFGKDNMLCDQGHQMVLRRNKGNGGLFLGCSEYPKHKFTRAIN